jgi:hypothetical protein
MRLVTCVNIQKGIHSSTTKEMALDDSSKPNPCFLDDKCSPLNKLSPSLSLPNKSFNTNILILASIQENLPMNIELPNMTHHYSFGLPEQVSSVTGRSIHNSFHSNYHWQQEEIEPFDRHVATISLKNSTSSINVVSSLRNVANILDLSWHRENSVYVATSAAFHLNSLIFEVKTAIQEILSKKCHDEQNIGDLFNFLLNKVKNNPLQIDFFWSRTWIVCIIFLKLFFIFFVLQDIFKTCTSKSCKSSRQRCFTDELAHSLTPFIGRDGMLRTVVAPASGIPEIGFEVFLIRQGTDSSDWQGKTYNRPKRQQHPKKKSNKNENRSIKVEMSYLSMFDRERYWNLMPLPMPSIPEEQTEHDSYEVVPRCFAHNDNIHCSMQKGRKEEEPYAFSSDEAKEYIFHEHNAAESVEQPCQVREPPEMLGTGVKVDEKGRITRFSYRLQPKGRKQ